MAKSLGQIHTVNYEFDPGAVTLAAGNLLHIDLPGQLTVQLQHMVRMMNSFKVVGIDMSFGPTLNSDNVVCSMSGNIQYFAPTKGRVEALKKAYTAVRKMMRMSGVDPTNAASYDFRPIIRDPAALENGADIPNQATIEDNGLASCLVQGPGGTHNIFGLYNQGIIPRETVGAATYFEEGFDIGLRSNALSQDWVLNETVTLAALSEPLASEEYEEIPFELSYSAADSPGGIATSDDFNWRPDPALYLSVLTGQLVIAIEEAAVDKDGVPTPLAAELEVAVHVAGWKSILRDHHSKRRSSKKGGKKHGRKRHWKR